MVDVGEGWVSVVAGGKKAVQAGAGVEEVVAALPGGSGPEAGLWLSEAGDEPLNVGAGV